MKNIRRPSPAIRVDSLPLDALSHEERGFSTDQARYVARFVENLKKLSYVSPSALYQTWQSTYEQIMRDYFSGKVEDRHTISDRVGDETFREVCSSLSLSNRFYACVMRSMGRA